MQPVVDALREADVTVDDLHAVEIIGGGVRVPKIQELLKAFFTEGRTNKSDPLELGLHLNGDEASALGAAFHGANVSTSFRVRKVGMLDYGPYAFGVRMTNDLYAASVAEGGGLMGFFKGGTKKKDSDTKEEAPEDWHKRATLFKAGARLGAKPRTIAFHHDADIVCELAYDDVDKLPEGTPKTVALYNISGIAAFAADMAARARVLFFS
jgi:hypoxia up-regulated 1